MRIVAVINQKGGAAKTTSVMSLAAIAAQHSKVLVVDVDPQGSVDLWAANAESLPENEQLPFDVVSETDPMHLLRIRELDYDMVFVDTPGNIDNTEVLKAVVENSDFVLMPTEPAGLGLLPLINTYNKVVAKSGKDYRAVITRVDTTSLGDAADAQEFLRNHGLLVCDTIIRRYKVHERAPLTGTVVTGYENSRHAQKAALDYKDLSLELMSIWAKNSKTLAGAASGSKE